MARRWIPIFPIIWNREIIWSFLWSPFLGFGFALFIYFFKIPNPFVVDQPTIRSAIAIYLILIAPIFEEIIFRQAIFSLLKKIKVKERSLLWCTAIMFGLFHLIGLSNDHEQWVFVFLQVLTATFLGYWFTWVRLKSESLLPGVLLHSFVNCGFVFGIMFYYRS